MQTELPILDIQRMLIKSQEKSIVHWRLLRTIRSCQQRWNESARLGKGKVFNKEHQRGLKAKFNIFLTRFRTLTLIPLFVPHTARLYFDSKGSLVSKTGIAIAELSTAGAGPKVIFAPPWPPRWVWLRKLARLIVRLPRALVLNQYVRLRAPRVGADASAMAVILGRDACIRFLKRYPRLHPVIISDVSPQLHMLGSAAAAVGNRVIWWQDDFHHVFPPPFPVCAAALLNERAVRAVRAYCPTAALYARPGDGCKPVRPIPARPRVGVAVNGLFQATEDQLTVLRGVRGVLHVDTLHLRLHPTSELPADKLGESWLMPAPREELLDDFLARLDIVVVGNSGVQLRILAAGVPVIHIDGLDHLGFDYYGYVAAGIVFGVAHAVPSLLSLLCEFYGRGEYLPLLTDLMGFKESTCLNPLPEMVKSLSVIGNSGSPVGPF